MSSILSTVEGGVVGVAVGEGVAAAVEPVVEPAKQQVWDKNRYAILDVGMLAELVVQRITDFSNVQDQAHRQGLDDNKLRATVEATFKAPGTAEALELWRRGRINGTQFTHALHKAGLEEQYIKPVAELFGERLAPADVANAIQQGFLANDSVLPAATPPDPNWKPGDGPIDVPVEQVALTNQENQPVSTLQEAEASGIDFDRLRVLAELAGLPPGEETLLDMWRRGIVSADTYAHGLREGHTKTKWTRALSARFYQLLPAGVIVRLRLKGWIGDTEFHDRMKLHGYRPEQADDWWHSEGRPATVRQTMIGLRRGGAYGTPIDQTPEPFRSAVLQSDIRNEWADLLYKGRETFPSAFVVRALLRDGVWDAAKGEDILYKSGMPRDLAHDIAQHYASLTTAAGATEGPRVKAAQTSAITEIRNAFLIGQADETQARDWLGRIGVDATEIDGMLPIWNVMLEVPQRGLTPSQIKKAYRNLPASWPRDRALSELELLGLTADDAATLLDE